MQVEFHAANTIRRSLRLIGVGGKVAEVKVEFEFFPSQCDNCEVFGHDLQHCLKAKAARDVVKRREIWQEVAKRTWVK